MCNRWAAKEAVIKAVSWRRLSFHDVLIQRSRNGGGVFAVILDKPSEERNAIDEDNVVFPKAERIAKQISSEMRNDLARTEQLLSDHKLPKEFSDYSEHHRTEGLNHRHGSIGDGTVVPSSMDELNTSSYKNDNISGQVAKVSISHDGDYATAVCLAAEEPMEGDVGGEAAAREPH